MFSVAFIVFVFEQCLEHRLSASMFDRGDKRVLQCGKPPPLGVGCYLFDAPGEVVKSWDFVPTLLGSRIAFSPCGPQPCQNIEATAP